VVYVCLTLFACVVQRSMMYFPSQTLPPPAEAGLPQAEVVKVPTEDGLELTSWFVPLKGSRYTAVVFHGNAGNVAYRDFLAHILLDAGCAVLLLEYRGYGGNPGSPSEQGFYRDARAAARFLESRPDVDPQRLVYYGESLGTGPATQLAVERPPAALVLNSPFMSMPDVAAEHYWYLPARWLVWDKFDNISKIGKVKCPVLVIHAERDRIVPTAHGKRVFEAANEPKELCLVPNAGHNDNLDVGRREIISAIRRVLHKADVYPKASEEGAKQ